MTLIERAKCTGCESCVNRCPKGCISLEKDPLGHLFPVIDKTSCIACGLCVKSCPETNKLRFHDILNAYAAWSLDGESRFSSASGGVAAELYRQFIEDGGWICGVAFDESFHAVHILTKDTSQIQKFRQSKYVYSENNGVNKQIEQLLKAGERVLFISLPCKVAGLLSFLGTRYENLYTVDIVCHGTPPYQNLAEHISGICRDRKAQTIRFRVDNEFLLQLTDHSNSLLYRKIGRTDEYLAAFLTGLNYRESCYQCSYACPKRISDITICDYWGLGQEIPFNHPYTGAVSAVLINTEKGRELFERTKPRFFAEERPVSEAVKGNAQLNAPTPYPFMRKMFEDAYKTYGFDYAVGECLGKVMKKERKTVRIRESRATIRRIAGIFIKRYRG